LSAAAFLSLAAYSRVEAVVGMIARTQIISGNASSMMVSIEPDFEFNFNFQCLIDNDVPGVIK